MASLCSPAQTPCVIMPQRTQPAPRRFDVLGVVASSSAASASSSSPPSPRSSLSAAVETTPQMVRPWWQHLRRRGRRRFQPARWRSTKWSSGSRPLEVRRIAQRIHTAHTHPFYSNEYAFVFLHRSGGVPDDQCPNGCFVKAHGAATKGGDLQYQGSSNWPQVDLSSRLTSIGNTPVVKKMMGNGRYQMIALAITPPSSIPPSPPPTPPSRP